MSSFLCFVCHSTVNADTNEETRDKYREVIGMNLCPDSHLCYICCHFLNKMWLFKSICLKRSLEYPVLFSEKGTINLQRSDTQIGILCAKDICLQHRNTKYHYYNTDQTSENENNYVQLHEEMNFNFPHNEVQTDILDHFNDNFLKSDDFNNEFLVSITKENADVNTRKDMEFIFGNDSIETPMENINKIELANLDEMTEVNITLTDLKVRNFEKFDTERHCVDKFNYKSERDENFDKSQREDEKSNNANYVDKTDYKSNDLERIEEIALKSPEMVLNSDFIETKDTDVIDTDMFDNNYLENNDVESDACNSDVISESEATNESKETKENMFIKIKLTLEEQKMFLDASRKEKKYIDAVFKCYSCAMGFLFKDSYQVHMMRHEESNGEHKCSVCTLRFANLAVLRSHRANHALRSSKHFQQHLKRAHNHKPRSYLCNICGKSCLNQAAVRTHMLTHINRKFTCDVCSSTYSSPYTLNQHKKKHDIIKSELHYCITCNIGYNSRKSLLAHQRNALAHKERVYKCPVCNKTCPSLRSLQNHTNAVHTRTKDLFCAVCPARYSTRKGLMRHMRSHSSEKLKPLLCHTCGQIFKSTSILKRHLKNVCEKKVGDEMSYYEQ